MVIMNTSVPGTRKSKIFSYNEDGVDWNDIFLHTGHIMWFDSFPIHVNMLSCTRTVAPTTHSPSLNYARSSDYPGEWNSSIMVLVACSLVWFLTQLEHTLPVVIISEAPHGLWQEKVPVTRKHL